MNSRVRDFLIDNKQLIQNKNYKQLFINAKLLNYNKSFDISELYNVLLQSGVNALNGFRVVPINYAKDSTISDIELPDSVNGINSNSFAGCKNLKSIDLRNVTHVGPNAFYQSGLESIDLTKVVTVGVEAFAECTQLQSVTLGSGCSTIEDKCFYGCELLNSIQFAAGLEEICPQAFAGCSHLTSVVLPDGVKHIDVYAFLECFLLTDITIPDSIETVSPLAFYKIEGLTIYCSELVKEKLSKLKGVNFEVI